jgi:hypothetical protein
MKVMSKTNVALLFMVAAATPAMAQDTLSSQLTACVQITGVLQRLACYDRVAHSLGPVPVPRSAPVQRPAPPSVAYVPPIAAAAPPVAAPPTGLGSERLPRMASAAPRRAQELTAGIAGITYDARGRFTITLDNGQVWRQLEGDTAALQGVRNSTARISRGALGSYDLNVVGRNATYRVLRLQ